MGGRRSDVEAKRAFIGAGCNRVVNNVSWGACDLVSFGAQNAVAIFCPKRAQILTTLPGHKATVNCSQWLPSCKFAFKAKHFEQHYLLSGDAEGVIILWELCITDQKWRNVMQLPQSHKKGVTCITGIIISENSAMFASSSSDGTVNIWSVMFPSYTGDDCKLLLLDSISVGSKPMVTLSLVELPGNPGHLALAMGGLDNNIHLFCGQQTGKFFFSCELKGHADWIRSLDFSLPVSIDSELDSVLLVSSAQDKVIRIWKITLCDAITRQTTSRKKATLASYIEGPVLVSGAVSYQISLESILIGHEDWVYSVEWQPPFAAAVGVSLHQPQSILSASMDKTMMIWQPEKKSGIWMNVVTVGEFGHCALGFYGGHWGPDALSILAHGYGGSFHLWRNVGNDEDNWQPEKVPSGHFAPVTDIAWARHGEYLLSVSHDQTARVFAPWKGELTESNDNWYEIARPQVHGHDINCATIVRGEGNHRFVSGAEEKVSRVFEAPLSFLKTLHHSTTACGFPEGLHVQILGANMSALGLSQKPIYVYTTHGSQERKESKVIETLETVPDAVPVELTEPPVEDQLAWHTLWPESHKLYGHGNELFSMCSTNKGDIVASSCKAQSAAVAEIWLWEVGTWKSVSRLQSHSLTVTQIEFSHDDKLLLSVSRDRQFSVFAVQRTETGEIYHKLIARHEAHKRIIWACSWNPFGHQFATGSRDKTVKIWAVEESSVKQVLTLPTFTSSVTALSWAGLDAESNYGVLAIGMESGMIEIWSITINEKGDIADLDVLASLSVRFDPFMCHVSAVNRLAWRPMEKTESNRCLHLASCGTDNCVRVFDVRVE